MDGAARGTGIMVLGMHRSGTSALAHVLQLAGADVGRRVLGASRGNEEGHWEDAFAVELHERLLANFGAHWNDPFALPVDWRQHEVVRSARDAISRYLIDDRARHDVWVVKDPRTCLFGELWRDAAGEQGLAASAVVLLRHPLEVADSLAARDGMGVGTALLLWLDYTMSALRVVEGMPSLLLTYDDLMDDWKRCASAMSRLPGGLALDFEGAADEIQGTLRSALRHHHREGIADLPVSIARMWEALQEEARQGVVGAEIANRMAPAVGELEDLLRLHAADVRQDRRALWERVAEAEALAEAETLRALPEELAELRARIDSHHDGLVAAFSSEVRAMQQAHASALATAERASAEAELARGLVGRLDELKSVVEEQGRALGDARVGNTAAAPLGEMQTEVEIRHAGLAAKLGEQIAGPLGEIRAEVEDRQAELVAKVREQLAGPLSEIRSDLGAWHRELAEMVSAEVRQAELVLSGVVAATGREQTQATSEMMRSFHDLVQAAADAEREAREDATMQRTRAASARMEASTAESAREDAMRRLEGAERDLAVMRGENGRLRESAATLQTVLRSRSWRLTRPARALARLLSGEWTLQSTQRLRYAVASRLARTQWLPSRWRRAGIVSALSAGEGGVPIPQDVAAGAKVRLAMQDQELPDVFFWSVIDWNFRTQRPQHLARALARKGHRVFYVSNNFIDSDAPGFSLLPLDEEGRLFQINLNLSGAPQIYSATPSAAELERLQDSLAHLLGWTCTLRSISIVQHPYWMDLSTMVPSPRLVYDCMDHHAGFDNNGSAILAAEAELIRRADLVIVTSDPLRNEIEGSARATSVIRNAADFEFFQRRPDSTYSAPGGRQVVGYFGAIAEWFDLELVREVAQRLPDAEIVLVGGDTAGAAEAFADLPNVRMVGEVPYAALPYWVHGFDVCLLPFKRTPLTEATNPVKVYEYLAAGKAVVSVDLPELSQFGGTVDIASDAASFADAVAAALADPGDDGEIARRQAFARGQTWADRADMLDSELRRLHEPRVSVVVLTYNNLAYTEACLFSIEWYSDYANLEVVVVDNASTDGSPEWLRQWADSPSPAGHSKRLILNESNLGFSAGNNVGLRASTGEVLVILNNDTYVTPGWVRGLRAHLLRDQALGLVGPVTNNIGNEARVEIDYSSMEEMIASSGNLVRANPGREIPLETAAFFCVAMPRAVHEAVGDLDEAFGIGFFEDDDYCRRVAQSGFRVACAEDVFVHHHLSASFGQLPSEEKQALFERNKAHYEGKWGPWTPHAYRPGKARR